jgi:hypothetical protein
LNYPGGEGLVNLKIVNTSVYLDDLCCMTGATRFLEREGVFYDKSGKVDCEYMIREDVVEGMEIIDRVYGYNGVGLGGVKQSQKLVVLKRSGRDVNN